MDRGFLFGDGVYEVIPSHQGRAVGLKMHLARLQRNLEKLQITLDYSQEQWQQLVSQLIAENGAGDLGVYLHVSRGTAMQRQHAFPDNITPTVFAFTLRIAPEVNPDNDQVTGVQAISQQDARWQHCDVKSTALLGHVLHHQAGKDAGADECILFNQQGLVTEATTCNLFARFDRQVITPALSNQLLPGITRELLLDILRKYSDFDVLEADVSVDQLRQADEIWLTSSGREVAPVIRLDNQPIGNGEAGAGWRQAQSLFNQYKYQY